MAGKMHRGAKRQSLVASFLGISTMVAALLFYKEVPGFVCPKVERKTRILRQACHGKKDGDVELAVVVPGLLYGAASYQEMCSEMAAQGYKAVVVPMEWWHWLPCLGGRSVRPVLERIDFTVDHVLAHGLDLPVPAPEYSILDLISDIMQNPGGVAKVGGSSNPDDFPKTEPKGADFSEEARKLRKEGLRGLQQRVALVGHSAGGWISRIFLSSRAYGGRSYCGQKHVHSLVTLGSPHANAPGVAFLNVNWIKQAEEQEQQDTVMREEEKVRHPEDWFSCPEAALQSSATGASLWGPLELL
eukprot:TRINITY_DN5531_c0_g1_i7.p1 TRINITY_DN5531_c0_g1~~TRINITY_DN5531_c0_g1_i7.p1  ORF type:complete len:301 (-),score=65.73 TRINITY_DN5531_c0_g1_i7:368-1270(-)